MKAQAFFKNLKEEKENFYSLRQLLQHKLLVVQEQQGKIVGLGGVLPRKEFLLGIVPKNLLFLIVKRDYQNCGIGQKLVKKVIKEALKRKYSYLALYVRKSNFKAIHIYQKLGFRKVYSPVLRTSHFMMLPLNPLGWLFFPIAHAIFFIVPLYYILKRRARADNPYYF